MSSKTPNYSGLKLLLGMIVLSTIVYSTALMDIQLAQKMFFFCIAAILFLSQILKYKALKSIRIYKPLFFLFLLLPLTFITSFVNGTESLLILNLSELLSPLSIVLVTIFVFIIMGGEDFFKTISFSVVIVATLFSVIGLLEVYGQKIITLPTIIGPGSTLGHRSFAAEFLLAALPFILILKNYVQKKNQFILLIISFIQISFLFFTRNRSSMIILSVVVLIYFLFILLKKPKGEKLKFILPVVSIIILSFLFALQDVEGTQRPEMESTVQTLFDTNYKSNKLRLEYWDASLQMISSNPLTGIGLMKWSGYFPMYSGDYFNDDNIFYVQSIHSHNDFLELASENGIASSIIFLLIVLFVCYSLLKKVRLNENYLLLLLSFLITLAFSIVAFPLQKFSSYFLASIAVGVAMVNDKGILKNSVEIKTKYLKIITIAALIIGIIVTFIRTKSEVNLKEAIAYKEHRLYFQMLQKLENVSQIFYPFDPTKQPVDYYRGLANYRLHRLPQALEKNLNAKELAPYSPTVMRNLIGAYQAIGDIDKAEQMYEQYKNMFPNCIDPQINLLIIYTRRGEKEKAEKLLSELEKKAPDNPRLNTYKKEINSN